MGGNNNNSCDNNSSSNITMVDDSRISFYSGNWTLFCTDKAKDAIRSKEKRPPRGCGPCKPTESMKKAKEKRDRGGRERKRVKQLLCKCENKVLTEWPKDFADLLEMLEGVANETKRGLKFKHKTQASGALGSGDFGRIIRLLGMVLGIGSAVWGI